MENNSKDIVEKLQLQRHPRGGYFQPTYRSELTFQTIKNITRRIASVVYCYLDSDDVIVWHRLPSDEIWHHYSGSTITLYMMDDRGNFTSKRCGFPLKEDNVKSQVIVPAGTWFAVELDCENSYSLFGCSAFPGVEMSDYEYGDPEVLMEKAPEHKELFLRLAKKD